MLIKTIYIIIINSNFYLLNSNYNKINILNRYIIILLHIYSTIFFVIIKKKFM